MLFGAQIFSSRRKPERETRIPGLALVTRAPKSAGPAGGNEAQAGYRWQSEPKVRYGGAPFSRAPRQNWFEFCRKQSGVTYAGGEDFGYFEAKR